MTNKPMLSVERELIQRIADHCKFWVDHPYLEAIADVEVELRALLDKSPTGWLPCSPNLLESGVDCATSPRWSSKEWDGHSHWHPARAAPHQGDPVAWLNVATGHVTTSAVVVMDWDDEEEQVQSLYAEQLAQVADQAQCEECKGWGYHENHHEGGGTECGECSGSGKAPAEQFSADTVVCRRYQLEQHPGQNFYHYDLEPVCGSVPVTVSDLITMVESAPVAVVMPERREPSLSNPHLSDADHEYNSALDDVARLNGVKP